MSDPDILETQARNLYDRILSHVKFLRKREGRGRLTRIDEQMGRSQGYFRRLLSGEIGKFDLHEVLKMLLALGVEPRSFFVEALGVCPERLLWELELRNRLQVEYVKKQLRWAESRVVTRTPSQIREDVWGLEERRLREREAVKAEAFHLTASLPEEGASAEILELRCEVFGVLGAVYRTRGALSSSAFCLGQALRLSNRLAKEGDERRGERSRAGTLQRVGYLIVDSGQFEKARTLLEAARELYLKHSDTRGVGRILVDLGVVLGKSGRYEEALERFGESLEILSAGDSRHRFTAFQGSGLCHLELGDIDRAERYLDRALAVSAATGAVELTSFPLWLRAQIRCARGKLVQAEQDLREIQRFYLAGGGSPLDLALVCLELARLLWLQGKSDELQQLTSEMMPLLGRLERSPLALAAVEEFLLTALRGELSLDAIETATRETRKGSRGETSLAEPESLLDQPLGSGQGPAS